MRIAKIKLSVGIQKSVNVSALRHKCSWLKFIKYKQTHEQLEPALVIGVNLNNSLIGEGSVFQYAITKER